MCISQLNAKQKEPDPRGIVCIIPFIWSLNVGKINWWWRMLIITGRQGLAKKLCVADTILFWPGWWSTNTQFTTRFTEIPTYDLCILLHICCTSMKYTLKIKGKIKHHCNIKWAKNTNKTLSQTFFSTHRES